MALHRIGHRRKPLLVATRTFSSSSWPNRPFPPPPPQADDPDAAARSPSPPPPGGLGAPPGRASTFFQDIRERLRASPPAPQRPLPRPGGGSAGGAKSNEEIRKMLDKFRAPPSQSAPGTAPSQSAPGTTPSFSDLLFNKSSTSQGPNAGNAAPPSFASIRDSLKLGEQSQLRKPYLTPHSHSIFRKEEAEMRSGAEVGKGDKDGPIKLMRSYSHQELGEKLGGLRPAGAGKDGKEWFSLEELQGRIAKLAKMEEEGDKHGMMRTMSGLLRSQSEKSAPLRSPITWLANIGQLSQPDYVGAPPQEELLERYFHPDHLSSEEKMKLELQRVRDEFKMSENDCGSARVQIAQLSVKIKHLSAVLHKKDKHSRKGLHEMIERRKKYLKYLRRTDWDSYCLVLSKLGLRDVPEYKAPDYKSKPTKEVKSKKSKSKKKKKMKA